MSSTALGELPTHWQAVPMFSVGAEVKSRNTGMKEDNLLSLSYGRIVRKDIDGVDGLLPESFETYQIVEPGDMVFRFTDLQNDQRSLRSGLVRERGIITSAYLAFRPKLSKIDPRYFDYLMRALDNAKVFYSLGGGVRQSLKFEDVKRLPIPLPPLEEQRAIADHLDSEIERIESLRQTQLHLIEILKERRFVEVSYAITQCLTSADKSVKSPDGAFIEKRLKYVAQIKNSNVDKKTYETGVQVRLCNYVDVYKNDAITPDLDFMQATATESEIQSFGLKADQVIITKDSESPDDIGRAAYVKSDMDGIVCGYHLTMLTPRDGIRGKWLKLVLDGQSAKQHFALRANGLTRYSLGQSAIGDLPIPVPPLEVQDSIIERTFSSRRKIDESILGAEKLLHLLQDRKRSLIAAAVTGNIKAPGF